MKDIKLSVPALVIALSATSASYAATDINFTGSVSTITCNTTVDLPSPSSASIATNTIDLGAVAKNATGTDVEFSIKPDSTCNAELSATNTASVIWTGTFDTTGLKPSASAAASDARVELFTANAQTTAVSRVASGALTSVFAGNTFKTDGAKFTAKLKAGGNGGTFSAVATYTMSYL